MRAPISLLTSTGPSNPARWALRCLQRIPAVAQHGQRDAALAQRASVCPTPGSGITNSSTISTPSLRNVFDVALVARHAAIACEEPHGLIDGEVAPSLALQEAVDRVDLVVERSDRPAAERRNPLEQAQERNPLEPVIDRQRVVEIETDSRTASMPGAFDACASGGPGPVTTRTKASGRMYFSSAARTLCDVAASSACASMTF